MEEWLSGNGWLVIGALSILCLALVLMWAGEASEMEDYKDKEEDGEKLRRARGD